MENDSFRFDFPLLIVIFFVVIYNKNDGLYNKHHQMLFIYFIGKVNVKMKNTMAHGLLWMSLF